MLGKFFDGKERSSRPATGLFTVAQAVPGAGEHVSRAQVALSNRLKPIDASFLREVRVGREGDIF